MRAVLGISCVYYTHEGRQMNKRIYERAWLAVEVFQS